MPLKDFIPDFKMYDDNATEQATTLDFMCTSALNSAGFSLTPG